MDFELLLIVIVYVAVIVMVVIWIRLVKAEQNRSKAIIKAQKEMNESEIISNWSAESDILKRRSFSCKETVTASERSNRVTYCSSLTSNLRPNDENSHFNEMCDLARRYWAHELKFTSITNLVLLH